MTTAYVEDFAALARTSGRSGWLEEMRHEALARFQATGFPTSREEDWRFNTLGPITGSTFRLAPADVSGVHASDVKPYLFGIPGASTLVFVNGRYAPGLSTAATLPPGVTLRNLAGALSAEAELLRAHLGRYARVDQSGFTALNTAFVKDGLFIRVDANVDAGAPIHAVFVTDPRAEDAATHPRNLILVERGARVAVIESYVGLGAGRYLTNAVTEAVVADGARFEHLKVQRESENAYHVATTHVHQARDTRGESFAISFGAAISRNNLNLVLDGPGGESQLFGVYMGRERQEVDNHTHILHAHPNCSTREVYKGILDGRSHGIFNGKIYVTPEAQKTDAKQTNRALLLSDQARIDTKPQLEIFADDVKCTHGATVGSLDEMSAFYLRSRGIAAPLARKILTYAFAAEVLEEIPYESVRRELETVVMSRLEGRLE